MNTIEKEKFLEEQGWVREGSDSWVKREWLTESERLHLEPNLCPNWYHYESFEEAYIIAVRELAEKTTNENCTNEVAMKLEKILVDAMNGDNWSDIRSAVRGFAKKTLYPWYLAECKGKPNPFIVKAFE